ncbi:DMT family transporter [Tepidiforma sp.]|uniref:DMT family transporter n=1 Tax=Tepidiforma sp. TaxID=2682230 RepID=UPI002ADE0E2F|nr:DMT family transporter [Tepidiforma sp.]
MPARHLPTLFLLSVIWGASFLFIEVQLEAGIAPLGVAGLRTLLGAAALLPFALPALRRTPPSPRTALLFGILGITNFAIPWTLIALAEHHISSGMASIANSTAPLWAAILSVAFLRTDALTPRRALGLAIGFSGIVFLAGPASLAQLSGQAFGVGLVLLSTLSYAASAIAIRRALGGLEPVVVALGQLVPATAVLLPLAFAAGSFEGAAWSGRVIAAATVLGVLGSGAAVALYMNLIQRIGAVRSTLVTYLIPPWGVLLGWALLGEPLGLDVLAGLVAILAGVLIVQGVVPLPSLRRAPSQGTAAAGR